MERSESCKAIYEPFMGSGVVGFNMAPREALFADSNPHVIQFYQAVQGGRIDGFVARRFLEREGRKLARRGGEYYYEVRRRFNASHSPLDFLFLNRSCFNGMIRFNRKGEFNVPFGHKPERFSKAYVTKIVNQVDFVYVAARRSKWKFVCVDYMEALEPVGASDFVYCDPPYAGRHVDYYDSWNEEDERALFQRLSSLPCRFILSTWHSNQHRRNRFLGNLWSGFHTITKEHFYHVGAKETNRKPMLEALVMNYAPRNIYEEPPEREEQLLLFEEVARYRALTNAGA
jgi:DNA adenine methylase